MTIDHKLAFKTPARTWTEALPLGNGRLGAMIYGGLESEQIALNEDSFWSGYKDSWQTHPIYQGRMATPDPQNWRDAADLALQGQLLEAEALLQAKHTGPYTQGYLPVGDLRLTLDHRGADPAQATDYRRELDYARGVHTVSYRIDGQLYRREAYLSEPDQVLVLRFVTEHPAGLAVQGSFESPVRKAAQWAERDQGEQVEGLECFAYLQAPRNVLPSYIPDDRGVDYAEDPADGGMALAAGFCRLVETPQETILLWSARTSYNGYDQHPWRDGREVVLPLRESLEQAAKHGYEALLARHLADHGELYGRVEWTAETAATQVEVRRLFNYSRYLLIAGSRAGTQPTNLQGIWNRELRAPWSANYTININAEMNYWLAEPLALSECHEPLLGKIASLATAGQATAQRYYGAAGSVAHHNTDLWNHTEPVGSLQAHSVVYAVWPLGLGWLSRHLVEHGEYQADKRFLVEEALPVLEEVVRFYLALLREAADGSLLFAPSTSPEHWHVTEDGTQVSVAAGTTMTQSIVYESFRHYLALARLAADDRQDQALCAEIEAALPRLKPWAVRADGALMEWDQDYPDGDPRHRHISHLYSLYPGEDLPEAYLEAAERTLEIRGEEGTGWSLGWKILFHARLGNAEQAYQQILKQLRPIGGEADERPEQGGSYPNLFSAHPPFQIDGNYASGAGVAAMFVQSRVDWEQEEPQIHIDLLPALPEAWGKGRIRGLRAKGKLELTIDYDRGKLKGLEILNHSSEAQTIQLRERHGSLHKQLRLEAGQGFGMEIRP